MNIKINNLIKIYPDGYRALNGLNLEIKPGMFGLLGPNGAHANHDPVAVFFLGINPVR